MPTLEDVARLVGVSAKTVSRVVNNQGEISEPTRQRVLSAIQELGYYPNIAARSLVNQRSYTLAVVTSRLEGYGAAWTISGMEAEAEKQGYSLLLDLVRRGDAEQIRLTLEAVLSRQVDGILWAAWEIDNNLDYFTPERLEKLPPLVFISAPRPSLSTVSVGNYEGARLATCHLLSSGCRKVGIITGPNRFRGSQDRLLGWKDCLHQANIEVETSLVAEGDWSSASGEAGARQLLATHPDLDGIFATNDRMALGALGCLHQMGRRVPEDVAVVGFDNSPESAHFWPPLTTIYQHLTEIGTTAVQLLCERIETRRKLGCESPPEQRYMTPHLVIRRSSQRTS